MREVLAATPFSDESHTGEAIEAKTEAALDRAGIVGLKHERLFFPVSDNGANMVAGWAPFGGGRCAVLGANGAGKSTLLRLLAGRHTPDNGVAAILDEPCRSPRLNGRVAYVPAACSSVRFCSCRLRDGVEVDASMAYRRDVVG